jgi:hypothetical protein
VRVWVDRPKGQVSYVASLRVAPLVLQRHLRAEVVGLVVFLA